MIVFLVLLLASPVLRAQLLYPAFQGGRWGYIDAAGALKIPFRFRSAGPFSEGLAAVRVDGNYGFIDTSGRFILPERYDRAEPFRNGIALVHVNGHTQLIDSAGRPLMQTVVKTFEPFGAHSFTRATTEGGKTTLINRQGRLLSDTVFSGMGVFEGGLAAVTQRKKRWDAKAKEQRVTLEVGLVDSTGRLIVPVGRYDRFICYGAGYALAVPDRDKDSRLLLNRRGRVCFTVPTNWSIDLRKAPFCDGLLPVQVFEPADADGSHYEERVRLAGYVDDKGKLRLTDPSWVEVTHFQLGHAFVRTATGWWLIDRRGRVLNDKPYESVLYDKDHSEPEDLFAGGLAFVETEPGTWAGIDTGGRMVESGTAFGKDLDLHRQGNSVLLESKGQYGFWDPVSGFVLEPRYDYVGGALPGGLRLARNDDDLLYVNAQGREIWRAEEVPEPVGALLNIDFMNRGYFYAASPYLEKYDGFGGHAESDNLPQPTGRRSGSLELLIDTGAALWENRFAGIPLRLANGSCDTAFFAAQDGRLGMVVEARDADGEWRAIEYLPSSWCGNSYHTLFLPPGEQWHFAMPRYEGALRTQLRVRVNVLNDRSRDNAHPVYSAVFEGSVNPGQFWYKRPYYRSGLMDPYND